MTDFEFSGTLDQGNTTTEFERTVTAESLKHAREKLYSQICSEHSVTRGKIQLEEHGE